MYWLEEHGVTVLHHEPILNLSKQYKEIKEASDLLGWYINPLVLGCWAKIDVPQICYELGINDKYVLMTDVDCLWRATFEMTELPVIISAGPEEEPYHQHISGGIYVWNLERAMNDYNKFLNYCLSHYKEVGHADNVGYVNYYGYDKITHMPPDWNFKTYWLNLGNDMYMSPKEKHKFHAIPKLLHYHGRSKPWADFSSYYKKFYGEAIVKQMKEFEKEWYQCVKEANDIPFKFKNNKTDVEKFSLSKIVNKPARNTAQALLF